MSTIIRKWLVLFGLSIALAQTTASCGEIESIPADELGKTVVIAGPLGQPIGAMVTVEGESELSEFSGYRFVVSFVDGKKLKDPLDIRIDGLEQWPVKTRIVARGYEYGTLRFLKMEDTNLPPDDQRFKSRQYLFLRFRATEVIEPKGLKPPQEKKDDR